MPVRTKTHVITVLKLVFAVGALWWVFQQIDGAEVAQTLKHAQWEWLLVAWLLLNGAQGVSALRMRYYYRRAGLTLARPFALALYYLCMFYNNLLPGGVGGDGYKIYHLKKRANFPALPSVRIAFSERASGLLMLCVLMLALSAASETVTAHLGTSLLMALAALLVTGYVLAARWFLKETPATMLGAAPYSLAIQLLTVAAAWAMLEAVQITVFQIEYLVVFIGAFILGAILPVSVGGVGIRELAFLYASNWLPLEAETGVAFALAYFLLYLMISLVGLPFMHRIHAIPYQQEEEPHGRTANS